MLPSFDHSSTVNRIYSLARLQIYLSIGPVLQRTLLCNRRIPRRRPASMPEQHDASSSRGASNVPPTRQARSSTDSSAPPTAHWHPLLRGKNLIWVKKYRTEISASSASLLSTLSAVSLIQLLISQSDQSSRTPHATLEPSCRTNMLTLLLAVSLGFRKNQNASVSRCFRDLGRVEADWNYNSYKFSSFLECVRHTYRTEGAHGFWRGEISSPSELDDLWLATRT